MWGLASRSKQRGVMSEPKFSPISRDVQSDTWVATDALGRALPGYEECGPPRPGKTVGIFYFLWLGYHDQELHDITQMLLKHPAAPDYGPVGMFHWWGEPHFGYYRSEDPFILQKHAQMLSIAGVDVIFLDVTNGFTYDETLHALCRTYREMRARGQATPQIAFLLNSASPRVARHLYETFYAQNQFPELWFHWHGKPLILASTDGIQDPSILDFFTWRHSWAWTDAEGWFADGRGKWPWLDHYPQKPGWHDAPDRPEHVSVNVAQHPISNIGRSFHDGTQPPAGETDTDAGLCFAEQWRRALEIDPEFIFITGWNEWVAQRFLKQDNDAPPQGMLGVPLQPGESYFVDQYNQEFSRDIEPMRGGYGDNYYYQMVENIRRFKGVRPHPTASGPVTIQIDSDFGQWGAVGPDYLDDIGDAPARDHAGWGDRHYVREAGGNDFACLKAARDSEFLYFYARTHQPISLPTGDNWMLLFLSIGGMTEAGWEGFQFLVNRTRHSPSSCSVERSTGGWNWSVVTEAKYRAAGCELHIAVPRAALNLPPGPLTVDFQWVDSVPLSGDILDFLDHGDTAPFGRFRYRYEEGPPL